MAIRRRIPRRQVAVGGEVALSRRVRSVVGERTGRDRVRVREPRRAPSRTADVARRRYVRPVDLEAADAVEGLGGAGDLTGERVASVEKVNVPVASRAEV